MVFLRLAFKPLVELLWLARPCGGRALSPLWPSGAIALRRTGSIDAALRPKQTATARADDDVADAMGKRHNADGHVQQILFYLFEFDSSVVVDLSLTGKRNEERDGRALDLELGGSTSPHILQPTWSWHRR
uniref:Secreted protein n=1 Tax=Leersia perrieri TaxID=77586 RepID=A0A0D9V6W2_9ORYZ